jgi:hypothetical protein
LAIIVYGRDEQFSCRYMELQPESIASDQMAAKLCAIDRR